MGEWTSRFGAQSLHRRAAENDRRVFADLRQPRPKLPNGEAAALIHGVHKTPRHCWIVAEALRCSSRGWESPTYMLALVPRPKQFDVS